MKSIHKTIIITVTRVLFVMYIILLAYFLFFSERYGRTLSSDYRCNLVLFKEMKRFIMYRKSIGMESFIVNIFGNILAFTPFGFALPIISRQNRNLFSIILLSFEFSLTIELIQLLLKVGIFDVDDLFMNTVGGMIGGICYFICYRVISKKNRI